MIHAIGPGARAHGLFALAFAVSLAGAPLIARAQQTPAPAAAPAPASAPAPTAAPAPAEAEQAPANSSFSREELEKLLAPIALYPDPLLAQLLSASAYPVQIVQAQRWLDKNKALVAKNDYSGIDKQDWDPAVKALARFPDIIEKMSADLDWTTDLGDAEVNQPQDVADVIQELRQKAEAAGTLKTTDQQAVEKVASSAPPPSSVSQGAAPAQQAAASYIAIQPTDPSTVYVPTYDPVQVYQPYTGIAPLLGFGAGVAVGALWNNNYWNWGTGAIYPPVWAGYSGWRPPYNGWRPGQPVCPGGRCGNINNGAINVGNNVNIGNVGNNLRPWRPNGNYRPGMGSKPGIGAGRPGGIANRPGGGNTINIGGGNAINRPGGNAINRPGGGNVINNRPSGGGAINNRPGGGQAANRPAGRPAGGGARPAANRPAQRPATRPAARPNVSRPGNSAMGGIRMGGANAAFANRGAFSRGGMPGGFGGGGFGGAAMRGGGGGGFRGGGGGGGFHGGGGGAFRGGGGRRSDMRLKHDIVLIGRLDDGLGFYRFVYNGGHTAYVGVMAQEVETVAPEAVTRGADGFLRVSYDRLGLPFETYARWVASGAHLPSVRSAQH